MKRSKILALGLALALTAGLLAGCTGGSGSQSPAPTPPPPPAFFMFGPLPISTLTLTLFNSTTLFRSCISFFAYLFAQNKTVRLVNFLNSQFLC